MPNRIAVSTLNASTIDILNVIRENATYEYQNSVPEVQTLTDIPKVGEVLYGTPALANQFINALVNRIALVRVQSATFNNPYSRLKKGYLEFGETVEQIFVGITKAVQFNPEKAAAREFKRTFPDVRSAFHAINWRVMYPITIQNEDLRQAFLSAEGVQNLIAKIVDQVYTAAEYDEFLLFKYLLIKAISHGKMKPVVISDDTDMKKSAIQFRGTSNILPFMSSDYNEAGVFNTTPKSRQIIFMDAFYNAQFDVDVLASAFNMDKTTYIGSLYLIDNFASFDNKRFEEIRKESDGLEKVTSEELDLMKNVKAVMLDENWFQVYDALNKFTETYISSGLYWNYYYHVWKILSYSPFDNAVVFVASTANVALPESITAEIISKDISEQAIVFGVSLEQDGASLAPDVAKLVQTDNITKIGIGVQKYGALLIPASAFAQEITLVAEMGGATYTGATKISSANNVGATVTLNKEVVE